MRSHAAKSPSIIFFYVLFLLQQLEINYLKLIKPMQSLCIYLMYIYIYISVYDSIQTKRLGVVCTMITPILNRNQFWFSH